MGDACFGHISVARHRIELIGDKAKPVLSTLHHAGPQSREFEKVEIERMQLQKIVSIAETKLVS